FYVDLRATPVQNHLTAQTLNFPQAAQFKDGNIEKGMDGKLYFARASGLGTLQDAANPNSAKNASAVSFSIANRIGLNASPGERGYILPNQLDQENYDHSAHFEGEIHLGPVGCPGDPVTAALLSAPISSPVQWSNGDANVLSTIYPANIGTNLVSVDLTNEIGCPQTVSTSFEVDPIAQVVVSANSTEYCPTNGDVIIFGAVAFANPNNEVIAYHWTKDGLPYNSGANGPSITANGPGVYCLQVEDALNECVSEIQCVTITAGPCANPNADFTYQPSAISNTYTIDVFPVDTRSCTGWHGWWVRENPGLPNEVTHTGQWILGGGGTLNFTFQLGVSYEIVHGFSTPCDGWQGKTRGINAFKSHLADLDAVEGRSYPNPVADVLHIAEHPSFAGYKLYDAQGKLVQEGHRSTADVRAFEAGIYFLQLLDAAGNMLSAEKIVKLQR
ncbi:MAG: T9SS type A sorting domain-containing protein, partial [Bacteroidota bacterium]